MRRAIIQNGGEVRFGTRLTGVSVKTARCAVCRRAEMISPASARCWPSATRRAIPLMRCIKTGYTLSRRHFRSVCASSICKAKSTVRCTANMPGIRCCRPQNTTCPPRGRTSLYTYIYCPGGVVVAAQSEQNTVVTNGMSYHARDGKNANSALAVSVDPADFDDGTPFGGVALQRRIERAAFTQTARTARPVSAWAIFWRDGQARARAWCSRVIRWACSLVKQRRVCRPSHRRCCGTACRISGVKFAALMQPTRC